jgi:hypothetical protein
MPLATMAPAPHQTQPKSTPTPNPIAAPFMKPLQSLPPQIRFSPVAVNGEAPAGIVELTILTATQVNRIRSTGRVPLFHFLFANMIVSFRDVAGDFTSP